MSEPHLIDPDKFTADELLKHVYRNQMQLHTDIRELARENSERIGKLEQWRNGVTGAVRLGAFLVGSGGLVGLLIILVAK